MKWPTTGFGFDAHDFSKRGTLCLGGVRFLGIPSLKGHSDADVVLHAIIDALLGAACLGDIGEHFPDTDVGFKGISSESLLKTTLQKIKRQRFIPYFIDITIVAQRPKLKNRKQQIRQKLAKALGLSIKSVNVKAKTPEGTRLLSSSGGIATWAVATLIPQPR